MPIPQNLDTLATDTLIFSPTLILNRRTMQPAIWVRVISRQTGETIENQVFEDYDDYLKFVDQRAANPDRSAFYTEPVMILVRKYVVASPNIGF